MPFRVCTGYGSTDTHALVLNDGRENPHPSRGQPYQTITLNEIWGLVQNPPVQPKEQGQWIIPSSYHQHDARSHEAQRLNGLYHMMAADIDQGNPSLQDVEAAASQALGDAARLIYSTRSAKGSDRKWRILIPLAQPLTGQQYGPFQASLFDALEYGGLRLDRTLERAGQLVYLPNKGEYYEYQVAGQAMLDPHSHPMAKRAEQYLQVQQQIETGNSQRNETNRSPVAAFRRKHSIEEMLSIYGYRRNGLTNHWASPYQTSAGFATVDRGDHWISLSDSDAAAGIGKATANGSRYGDAFDLYVHFQCQGNHEQALAYARQCLAAEDNNRYGEATAEHGKALWYGLIHIGDKLGPAGKQLVMEEAAARIEEIKTEAPQPDKEGGSFDWNIDWPPGLVGEVAKHIYRSSKRPVKQFAIAMALYLMAGMAGRKYNVEEQGINLYFALVGNSATGKGEARRSLKRLYGAMGMKAQDPVGVASTFDNSFPASAAGLHKMFADDDTGVKAMYKEDADAMLEMMVTAAPGSNGDLLRSAIGEFWDLSGAGLNMGGVRRSKLEDSSRMLESPSLTLGFDIQVDPFKEYLGNEDIIKTGFAQRFIYVTRIGPRVKSNKGARPELPEALLDHLVLIWQGIRSAPRDVVKVLFTPDGRKAFEDLDDKVEDLLIQERGLYDEILNRQHMQAAKVAALLAIGVNQIQPVISKEQFEWAEAFVAQGYKVCQEMIKGGEVGGGHRVRKSVAIKAITDYVHMAPGRRSASYKVPKALDGISEVIPERYFMERLSNTKDFRGSDLGPSSEDLIRRTLSELVRQGFLEEVDRETIIDRFKIILRPNVKGPFFALGAAYE